MAICLAVCEVVLDDVAASRRSADQFGDLDVVEDLSVDLGSFFDTEHISRRHGGGWELGRGYGGCSFSKRNGKEETEKILAQVPIISTFPFTVYGDPDRSHDRL